MCKSYSGPAKSGPIKRLTRLNSGLIKRSRLYLKNEPKTSFGNNESLKCSIYSPNDKCES